MTFRNGSGPSGRRFLLQTVEVVSIAKMTARIAMRIPPARKLSVSSLVFQFARLFASLPPSRLKKTFLANVIRIKHHLVILCLQRFILRQSSVAKRSWWKSKFTTRVGEHRQDSGGRIAGYRGQREQRSGDLRHFQQLVALAVREEDHHQPCTSRCPKRR